MVLLAEDPGWVLDIVESVLACGVDPAQWSEIPRLISKGFPESAVLLQGADAQNRHFLGLIQHGMRPDFLVDYANYYAELNPWKEYWARQPVMRPFSADETMPALTFAGTEFYEDFLRAHGGIEGAAGVKVFDSAELFAWVAVHYDRSRTDRYGPALKRLLQVVAPVIRGALLLDRSLSGIRAPGVPIEQVLDALRKPAFLVDVHGSVRAASQGGLALTQSGEHLRLDKSGRLRLRDPKASSMLAAALATDSGQAPAPLQIPVCSESGSLEGVLQLLPLTPEASGPAMSWLCAPERLFLALFETRPGAETVAEEPLRRIFGLTQAEARLSGRLAMGASLDEVAAALGISKETARAQLKSVFAKTDTHRQAELVALLARLTTGAK